MKSGELNRSLQNKKVDSFYVTFLRLPVTENTSNILGRQVVSIDRPTINFNISENYTKGVRQSFNNKIEYDPVTIVLDDDENSLVIRSIIEQIKRQNGINSPSFNDSKFDVNVKCFDSLENNVEEFTFLGCFVSNISNSTAIYTDSTDNQITITLTFNTIDYKFPILEA